MQNLKPYKSVFSEMIDTSASVVRNEIIDEFEKQKINLRLKEIDGKDVQVAPNLKSLKSARSVNFEITFTENSDIIGLYCIRKTREDEFVVLKSTPTGMIPISGKNSYFPSVEEAVSYFISFLNKL